ncbi:hypothetical protein FD755_012017, partial [Muntiacus reevesi]
MYTSLALGEEGSTGDISTYIVSDDTELNFKIGPCVQNQVDEVIDVMQENITKVIERGERLDELQDKSESLSDNATAFSNRSKQLRRQMWWRGCKIISFVRTGATTLLLIII